MRGTIIGTAPSNAEDSDQRNGAAGLSERSRASRIDVIGVGADGNAPSGRATHQIRDGWDGRFHSVYALVDPRDNCQFYIEITQWRIEARLSAHCADPASSAYHRLRDIKAAGFKPIIKELCVYRSRVDAYREEARRIAIGVGLLNRSPGCVWTPEWADRNLPAEETVTVEPDGDYLEYLRYEE